jgi:hypothetical protein
LNDVESILDEYCLKGLLRSLNNQDKRLSYMGSIQSVADEDIQILRMWWALSFQIGDLARRCIEHPREIAYSLNEEQLITSGEVSGAIDASASVLLQMLTADSAAFVITDVTNSWLSGPNRLIAKTLLSAQEAIRDAALHANGGIFNNIAKERLRLIDDALRINAFKEILSTPLGRSKILAHERKQASRAQAPIYQIGWKSALLLYDLESLEKESIQSLLKSEVLPQMEVWRKFELACLIKICNVLSSVSGKSVQFDMSFTSKRPSAVIDDIKIWWQRTSNSRPISSLDLGEKISFDLAESLNILAGSPRTDITIEKNNRVISIVECKWFNSPESVSRAIIDACYQLTIYARNAAFHQNEDVNEILPRCLIAVAQRSKVPLVSGDGLISCVGLDDFESASLEGWAQKVISA